MADYSHADLEREFAPLGSWGDVETRARIAQIVQEGTQAPPEEILAGLPQTDGLIIEGGAAPADSLFVTTLDNTTTTFAEIYAQDNAKGKCTLLNFGSYS